MWQKIKDRYYWLTNGQRYLFWFVLLCLVALFTSLFFLLLSVLPKPVTGVLIIVAFIALMALVPWIMLMEEEDW